MRGEPPPRGVRGARRSARPDRKRAEGELIAARKPLSLREHRADSVGGRCELPGAIGLGFPLLDI